jgi:hypothetical protein
MNHFTEGGIKRELKEEVNGSDEGQGVENACLDCDNLIP